MEDFSLDFQHLVGKTVNRIEATERADEGLTITFNDGSVLIIGYSSDEGYTRYKALSE